LRHLPGERLLGRKEPFSAKRKETNAPLEGKGYWKRKKGKRPGSANQPLMQLKEKDIPWEEKEETLGGLIKDILHG